MRVVYGVSVPPGLQGDTLGEVRLRVERMMLHKEAFDNAADWEIDACVVEPRWWGENAETTDERHLIRCLPSTPTTARGVTNVVFPCKTVRAQLEQYFLHMDEARQGLALRVVVPPAATGRRRDIPIGVASVRLHGLTPKTAIDGWFIVASVHSGEAIGRIKIRVSVDYFEASKPATPKPKAANVKNAAVGPIEFQAAADGSVFTTEAAAPANPSSKPPLSTSPRDRAPAAADAQPSIPSPPVFAAPTPSTPTPMAAPTVDIEKDAARIQAIIKRGLQIREAMTHAVTSAPSVFEPSAPSLVGTAFGSATAAAPFRRPPSLVDPLVFTRAEEDDDEGNVSELTPSERSDDADDADALLHLGKTHAKQDPNPGISFGRVNPRSLKEAQQVVQPTEVKVRLGAIAFAGRGFDACQVALRVSRDVLFFSTPDDPMWSPIAQLPVAQFDGGFTLDVAAYSTNSKIVLELYGVHTPTGQMALAGICVLPLHPHRQEGASFRSPASGTVEAQCTVLVDMFPLQLPQLHRTAEMPPPPVQPQQAAPAPPLDLSHAQVAPRLPHVPAQQNFIPPPHGPQSPRDYEFAQHQLFAAARSTPNTAASSPRYTNSVVNPSKKSDGNQYQYDLRSTEIRGIDELRFGTSNVHRYHFVVILSKFIDGHGDEVDDWTCDVDTFVTDVMESSATPSLRRLPFHSRVQFGMDPKEVASCELCVLAWVGESPPPQLHESVSSPRLLDGCSEIGTVTIDLRPHLKYGLPSIAGWYHIVGLSGTVGQLRLEFASGA